MTVNKMTENKMSANKMSANKMPRQATVNKMIIQNDQRTKLY